jgi:serine/threonine protein kinase
MTVAVKKLMVAQMSAADIADFDREVAFLHSLPYHPHVLQIHGVSIDQQRDVYYMIHKLDGEGIVGERTPSTHRTQGCRRCMSSLSLSELCLQGAMTMNYLHTLPPPKGSILHRDLKSMNFLVDKHGEIKLCQ